MSLTLLKKIPSATWVFISPKNDHIYNEVFRKLTCEFCTRTKLAPLSSGEGFSGASVWKPCFCPAVVEGGVWGGGRLSLAGPRGCLLLNSAAWACWPLRCCTDSGCLLNLDPGLLTRSLGRVCRATRFTAGDSAFSTSCKVLKWIKLHKSLLFLKFSLIIIMVHIIG